MRSFSIVLLYFLHSTNDGFSAASQHLLAVLFRVFMDGTYTS